MARLEAEKAKLLPSYAPQREAASPIAANLRGQIAIGIEIDFVRIAIVINHARPIVPEFTYVARAAIPVATIYEIGRAVLDITAGARS